MLFANHGTNLYRAFCQIRIWRVSSEKAYLVFLWWDLMLYESSSSSAGAWWELCEAQMVCVPWSWEWEEADLDVGSHLGQSRSACISCHQPNLAARNCIKHARFLLLPSLAIILPVVLSFQQWVPLFNLKPVSCVVQTAGTVNLSRLPGSSQSRMCQKEPQVAKICCFSYDIRVHGNWVYEYH